MKMTIKSDCSDAELNAAVATMIGWKLNFPLGYDTSPNGLVRSQAGRVSYSTSADAALEIVEKWVSETLGRSVGLNKATNCNGRWHAQLTEENGDCFFEWGPTLARALCLVLLMAHGVEVTES